MEELILRGYSTFLTGFIYLMAIYYTLAFVYNLTDVVKLCLPTGNKRDNK